MPSCVRPVAVLALCLLACSGNHNPQEHDTGPHAGDPQRSDGGKPPPANAPRPDGGTNTTVGSVSTSDAGGTPATQTMAGRGGANSADSGGIPAARTTARSGSRLKLMYLDGGGGARVPGLFFDTQENVRCYFGQPEAAVDDGSALRCLPANARSMFYTDDACTVAVVRGGMCENAVHAGRYVTVWGRTTAQVFEFGASQTASVLYGKADDGRCLPTTWSGTVQLLAAKVSSERFVAGKLHKQAVPGLADLTLSYTEGEDGSLISDGLEYKGEACEPRSLTDSDDVYCVPTRTAQAGGSDFETTDCTGPQLAATGSPTPEPPLLINQWQRDEASGCERISGYYEVGAMTTQRSLRFETMCLPVSAGGSSRHYHLGAAIEEARFPRLKAVEVGSGRLRKTQYQGPDGTVVGWTHDWRDTMLDMRCTLELTITPELLCRPADVHGVSRVFSDAQCARVIHDFRTCTPLDAVHYTSESRPSMACPGHHEITVHRVTRYMGPVYASDRGPSPISCEPIDGAAKPYFQLGTALSSSELAAFEYTME